MGAEASWRALQVGLDSATVGNMGTKAPVGASKPRRSCRTAHAKEGAAVCQKRDTLSNCSAATRSLVLVCGLQQRAIWLL